jgi:hypothetical protein
MGKIELANSKDEKVMHLKALLGKPLQLTLKTGVINGMLRSFTHNCAEVLEYDKGHDEMWTYQIDIDAIEAIVTKQKADNLRKDWYEALAQQAAENNK